MMADGDIIPGQPNGFYQNPYENLCETKFDLNQFTWDLMDALLKDIKLRGADMIVLAKHMGEHLEQAIGKEEANLATLSRELEQIKNQYLGATPHYFTEIVLRAGKRVINEFRYGERKETKNLPEVLVGQYMKELYQSRFEARIKPSSNYHGDVDNAVLSERIQDTRLHIYNTIDEKWAIKATVDEDVINLKRPKRSYIKPIDMEEDLLLL